MRRLRTSTALTLGAAAAVGVLIACGNAEESAVVNPNGSDGSTSSVVTATVGNTASGGALSNGTAGTPTANGSEAGTSELAATEVTMPSGGSAIGGNATGTGVVASGGQGPIPAVDAVAAGGTAGSAVETTLDENLGGAGAGGSAADNPSSGGAAATGGSGGSGVGGLGGSAPTGGATGAGGNTGSMNGQMVCPEGPFPSPMVESSKDACQDFNLAFSWNEGPTWVASQNAFFFSNFVAGSASGGDIIKYTPGGSCETFMQNMGCNGLAVSTDGNLLAACQQTRSILRIDLETKQTSTVADSYMGMMLDTPNDLIQHSNGSIYFTNPTNELAGRPVGVGPAAFRVDPSGAVSMIGEGNCNGIGLSPDETTLYVLLLGMWDLDAQGAPSNPQSIFTRGDGMAVDCAGNVYANASIFSPNGQSIGTWGNGTNLAFGGEDGRTVLVTGPGTQLRELTVNVPGLP